MLNDFVFNCQHIKVDVFEKYGIKYIRILQHEKGGKKFNYKIFNSNSESTTHLNGILCVMYDCTCPNRIDIRQSPEVPVRSRPALNEVIAPI